MEFADFNKPSVGLVVSSSSKGIHFRPLTLGRKPAKVSVVDDGRLVADSLRVEANPGADQAFGTEHRHLRVVGDRADPPVGLGEAGDTCRAEALEDGTAAQELDRSTEGIPDGAAEQTARYPLGLDPSNVDTSGRLIS